MGWFGGGGKPNKGGGQWVERQTYRHDRPGVDGGGRGKIETPQGCASYDRNAHDLTVHGIVAAKPGGGAFLMQQIAEDAEQMGKPFVRTTMTALSAFGFYHGMGMIAVFTAITRKDQDHGWWKGRERQGLCQR